ncbi:MAG: DUF4276 family protein, partial [Myxococcota bacterium]
VAVHAVKREMETWLLADTAAISRVAGGGAVTPIGGQLEDQQHAKEALMKMLSRVAVPYTPAVCRNIAQEIDLSTLRGRCPSFASFERKVILPVSRSASG